MLRGAEDFPSRGARQHKQNTCGAYPAQRAHTRGARQTNKALVAQTWRKGRIPWRKGGSKHRWRIPGAKGAYPGRKENVAYLHIDRIEYFLENPSPRNDVSMLCAILQTDDLRPHPGSWHRSLAHYLAGTKGTYLAGTKEAQKTSGAFPAQRAHTHGAKEYVVYLHRLDRKFSAIL